MIDVAAIMFDFFPSTPAAWAQRILTLVVLWLSLAVHEWAHAISAFRLGDDTAEREGRLTLNPISHVDPIGTVLLPLMGVPFGWAKPVPINPTRFARNVSMTGGMALSAFAGPLSNFVLATLSAVVWGVLLVKAPESVTTGSPGWGLLSALMQVNVALAVFNLLPLYPLDGHRLVEPFIPPQSQGSWTTFKMVSPFILMLFMLNFGHVMAVPINALLNMFRGLTIALAHALS